LHRVEGIYLCLENKAWSWGSFFLRLNNNNSGSAIPWESPELAAWMRREGGRRQAEAEARRWSGGGGGGGHGDGGPTLNLMSLFPQIKSILFALLLFGFGLLLSSSNNFLWFNWKECTDSLWIRCSEMVRVEVNVRM
jgi:hypothetical protein